MRGLQRREYPLEAVVLAVICGGYVAWVLSMPMFPTQDGPMHLYYAHVMLALFGHGPPVYERFYRIKHLLPPYSAYYYLLIGLSRFAPLLLADKLVICGYMISFVYGFRYLARAVGPAADQASLFATLLVLNWPLGMGFVNFCLGVSLALWTLGVWMRTVGRHGLKRRALFVAMCVGLVFVHPVPLLAVIVYCGVDLLVRKLRRDGQVQTSGVDVLTLALGALTLGYLKLFTISHAAAQMSPAKESRLQIFLHDCMLYARGQRLSFFNELFRHATGATRIYHLLLMGILPLGLALAARQSVRRRQWGSLWLWLTVGMALALPLLPHDINGSHYFAERLVVFVWLASLLAMSGYASMSRVARVAVALGAVAGTIAVLLSADNAMRPIARDMARIEERAVEYPGEVGIALGDWTSPPPSPVGLTFNPYIWAGVHYFRHNDAVLYNTPWLDLKVIPLGVRDGLATGVFAANVIEDVPLTRTALSQPELRAKAMTEARFIFENHFDHPGVEKPDPLFAGWQCAGEQGWYAVCVP